MIKYTSKDIIERACQLADLQNSDFISDSEKSALLNESWNTLYQKIINAGDRSFIRSVSVSNGYRLPKDFYQLSSLYVTKDKTQINRLNAAELNGYSITNNTLYLSPEYDNIEVTLEYYPIPKTVFYNSGKKEQKSFTIMPMLIIDDEYYLAGNGQNSARVIDYASGATIDTVSTSPLINCSNGMLERRNDKNYFMTWTNFANYTTRDNKPFVIKGRRITYDEITTDLDLSAYIAVIMDETETQIFYLGIDGYLYDRNFEYIPGINIAYEYKYNFYCRQDGLYLINGEGKCVRVDVNVVETFSFGVALPLAFVDDTYIITYIGGKGYYKTAYGFNTLFQYPNNIYYTILAYMLAISFKIKQNGDVTLLQGKLEEATNQFYDSIQRDVNETYNIKNVYKNSRGRIW